MKAGIELGVLPHLEMFFSHQGRQAGELCGWACISPTRR
jgi:hypothetical protein